MEKTFTFHTRSRLWILCAAVCMVCTVPLHAQTRRISLNLKNATIQQAVIALQQQGYSLSVKAGDVDMKAPVNIQARNEELQAVVDRIFAGQGVNCIINDKSILITKLPSRRPAIRPSAEVRSPICRRFCSTLHGIPIPPDRPYRRWRQILDSTCSFRDGASTIPDIITALPPAIPDSMRGFRFWGSIPPRKLRSGAYTLAGTPKPT